MSVKFLLFSSAESLGTNRFPCTLELRLAFEILKVILQGSLGLSSDATVLANLVSRLEHQPEYTINIAILHHHSPGTVVPLLVDWDVSLPLAGVKTVRDRAGEPGCPLRNRQTVYELLATHLQTCMTTCPPT